MYRIDWECGDTSITDSYAPEECPFCKLAQLQALIANNEISNTVVDCKPVE